MTETHFATVALENISLTLPPATERNADPQKPVMNRNTKSTPAAHVPSIYYPPSNNQKVYVPMSGANAIGHENKKNNRYDTWYTIFLPYTSLNGPTNNGPSPSPITNRLTPNTVTSLDTLNSIEMPASVNDAFDGSDRRIPAEMELNSLWMMHM